MVDIPEFQNIHFPRQISLIKKLRQVSFIINDITVVVASFVFLIWLANTPTLKALVFEKSAMYPFTPVLFILASIPLFFGAKLHLIDTHYDAQKEKRPSWFFGVPILVASIVAILGFVNFIGLTSEGILTLFHTSSYTGLCFFLIGLALIPPYTLILHRFHITQGIIFLVSGINVFVVLESLYQVFSPLPVQHITQVSLLVAFTFIFFCVGILLRWTNRGFFGNFTLDSTASTFGARVLMINLIAAPAIVLITLYTSQNTTYNIYQVIAIIVVCFTITSSLLLWINIKLLYRHELEHLLMRESLQAHNVDLKKEEVELRKRMEALEQDKQRYLNKLTSRNAWQDAIDKVG